MRAEGFPQLTVPQDDVGKVRGRSGRSVAKVMSEIDWECIRLMDRSDM